MREPFIAWLAGLALGMPAVALVTAPAFAGGTFSLTGSVVDERGKPIAGAYVFMCDGRNGVKLHRGLVVAGPAGANDPICGNELYLDMQARPNGSFAFVARAVPYVIVGVQEGRFVAEECAYRAPPDAALHLKFVLRGPSPGVSSTGAAGVPACPAESRPEFGMPQDTYVLENR